MELVSINVGVPRTWGDPNAEDPLLKEWTSGIVKQPVAGRLYLTRLNLTGDQQYDLRNHGGADKAINAYPVEHYEHWRAALGVAEMASGGFGENFTTRGLVESSVCIGDVYEVGGAVVQISQPRQPCWKLARRWQVKDFAVQVQDAGFTGWYFRVLGEGFVEAGDEIRLAERPFPQFTVSGANDIMYERNEDVAAARELAACEALSTSWREELGGRGTK